MKVKATGLPESTRPRWQVSLYQDPNGNWFASVERDNGHGISTGCTATFTSPHEAVAEALATYPPDAPESAT